MSGTRDGAVAQAERYFDDGSFVAGLARLVAAPTQSQIDDAHPALRDYFAELICPELNDCGFTFEVFDNPEPAAGPLLLAHRHEGSPAVPFCSPSKRDSPNASRFGFLRRGTMTRVDAAKIQAAGYAFRWPTLELALRRVLQMPGRP